MCLFSNQGINDNEEKECPLVISVNHIGIYASQPRGCVMNRAWLDSFRVACHHSFFNPMVYIDLPNKKLTCLRTVSQGQFGYIDFARYDTVEGTKEVYVKRPIQEREEKAIYEPYLQQMVREGLARFGFPHHVPRVLEVFRLRNDSVCFAMEQVEDGVTLDVFLNTYPSADLSPILVEILYQVTMMVWFMNDGLGVNHRDLKPSNFLLRVLSEPVTYSFQMDGVVTPVEWTSRFHLSMIDFGFACVGAINTRRARVSLSTIYSEKDPCPKDGRDIFLFLGYLYGDYYQRMTPTLRSQFESWLSIPRADFCGFLRREKESAKQWLYYLTGSEQVNQLRSTPLLIIQELMKG
jgi:serine/threonine protein kinase